MAHDGSEGLSPDGWLPDRISVGVLARVFTPELVDAVVEDAGAFTGTAPAGPAPAKTKKSGDFPARKPGEPSVTNVIRKIEFHLVSPHMIGELVVGTAHARSRRRRSANVSR